MKKLLITVVACLAIAGCAEKKVTQTHIDYANRVCSTNDKLDSIVSARVSVYSAFNNGGSVVVQDFYATITCTNGAEFYMEYKIVTPKQ